MENLTNDKMIVLLLVLLCVMSAAAVLPKIGIFTVALRRGRPCSWLAWLPFGHRYLLGDLADQYRSLSSGTPKKRRVLFTVLEVLRLPLFLCAAFLLTLAVFMVLFGLILLIGTALCILYAQDECREYCIALIQCVLLSLGCLVLLLPSTVLRSVVLLDYYRSCRPNSAVKYLVLGLTFPFLQPIFQFVCRRDDAGMPTPPIQLPQSTKLPEETPKE